jgi:hypothetical protein
VPIFIDRGAPLRNTLLPPSAADFALFVSAILNQVENSTLTPIYLSKRIDLTDRLASSASGGRLR